MGWSKNNSSVKLDSYLVTSIDELANQLSFDIVITDGQRTPRDQVLVMYAKLEKTPPEDLTTIYANDQFANDIMDSYPDIDEGIKVVEHYLTFTMPSKHLSNLGFDVRTTGGGLNAPGQLNNNQVQLMVDTANTLGFFPFLESDHLHIDLPKNEKKNSMLVFLLILGGFLWISKKS